MISKLTSLLTWELAFRYLSRAMNTEKSQGNIQ